MGDVIYMDNSPLSRWIKEDRKFNQEIVNKLQAYWANLGHEINYTIEFVEKHNYHTIRTNDLKNGVPVKKPSVLVTKNLLR